MSDSFIESRCPSIYISVPFHVIFLRLRTGLITRIEPILLHAWSPSYYTCGALKTGGGCRASIAHAWSPKNGGWRQNVHCPPLQNCIGPTIRIGREILCLPYAGFFVSTAQNLHFNLDCNLQGLLGGVSHLQFTSHTQPKVQ